VTAIDGVAAAIVGVVATAGVDDECSAVAVAM